MRRFVFKYLFYFIPFLVLFGVAYYLETSATGDLGRLGKILCNGYRDNEEALDSCRTIEMWDFEGIDTCEILTIGSSFSQRGAEGYQQFLSQQLCRPVCNLNMSRHFGDNSQDFLASYLISDDMLPCCKVLIIEDVERYAVARLRYWPYETLKYRDAPAPRGRHSFDLYAVTSNLRLCMGINQPVLQADLDGCYFQHRKHGDKLYFYYEDLDFGKLTEEDYSEALIQLARLHDLAAQKGTKMLYVVAADKYDAYSAHILHNWRPSNPTMQYFAQCDTCWYLDTKDLLTRYIDKGIKDIYKLDDSHWSGVGASIVAQKLAAMVENQLDTTFIGK